MTAPRTAIQDRRLGSAASSAAQDAALRGATLAFSKPPVKPKPKINTYSGRNGALVAANSVEGGSLHQSQSQSQSQLQNARNLTASRLAELGEDQKLTYQHSGSSVGSRSYGGGSDRNAAPKWPVEGRGYLQPPGTVVDRQRSASFIAATLAASRSASISSNATSQQDAYLAKARRPASAISRTPSIRSVDSSRSSDVVLDTTPIPPTTSLIGMFEQNEASATSTPRLRTPRASTTNPTQAYKWTQSPVPTRARTPSPRSRPVPRPPVKATKPTLATIQSLSERSEPSEARPAGPQVPTPTTKLILIPRKTQSPKPEAEATSNDSSDDSFVSASDYQAESTSPYQLSFRAELAARKARGQYSNISATSSVTAVDSLANAIVASSLASSRAVSPTKSLSSQSNSLYPVAPPPRRGGLPHLFHHSKDEAARTPSPAKPPGPVLRATLRKPKSKEDVDEREKRQAKKSLVKKHPNKHHEGDRQRWRDAITERERKRYEAVWASNKGLFANDAEPGSRGRVVNVVVRDVWNRSRLHPDVLEEVWELVDRGKRGSLAKEEFVVGMWLVDQRLKGRKLPIRVRESVWKSVGLLGDIKVRRAYR